MDSAHGGRANPKHESPVKILIPVVAHPGQELLSDTSEVFLADNIVAQAGARRMTKVIEACGKLS